MIKRIRSEDGFKFQSSKGWLFVSLFGDIYRFHFSFGKLAISLERPYDDIRSRKAARRAAKVRAEEVPGTGKCKHGKPMTEECRHCWHERNQKVI